MSEIVFIVEQAPEGGYIARALGESGLAPELVILLYWE